MGKINVLDQQIANLIAAGEVVDRPASVVKEMLENSIDAGAKNITLEIKRGGVSFIRVSDDGCGMTRDDVPVCIKRHATSKIKEAADLDAIVTLGFRGEALAAIGSVSKLRIMTKPHGDKMGTMLQAEAGEILQLTETGCTNGTTIIVEDLFANIPARRKFLKKDSSEAMAVTAVIEKLALSRPDLSFRFISDGALRFATNGDGDLKNCIYAVLGRDFAHKLTYVEDMTDGIGVKGFIGTPENIRANRNYQNFFINGRYVKSRTAMAALEQAFSSYIPGDKFPVCVLSIEIHPAYVDVNVHPAKLEVKFSNEQLVFNAVYSAIRGVLSEKLGHPDSFLKTKQELKREAKALNGFVPILDGGSAKKEQIKLTPSTEPDIPASGIKLPEARNSTDILPAPIPAPTDDGSAFSVPKLHWEKQTDKETAPTQLPTPPLPLTMDPQQDGSIISSASDFKAENSDTMEDPLSRFMSEDKKAEKSTARIPSPPTPIHQNQPINKKSITPEKAPTVSISTLNRSSAGSVAAPPYKMIGEVFNSYIMAESEGKLLLIDKHAAHERILFEDMKKNLREESTSQMLLLPLNVLLTPDEIAAIEEYRTEIEAAGYGYDITEDKKQASVYQIPAFLANDAAEAMFVTMAGRLANGTGDVSTTRDSFFEQALYQASCKAAIKAGRIYDESHLKWICERVLTNPEIRFCPHGRPVAFEMTQNDIEHSFKRS